MASGWSRDAKTQLKGGLHAPSPVRHGERGEPRGARKLQAVLHAGSPRPQGKRKKSCSQEEGCKKPLTVLFTFLASMMNSGELEFS